VSFAAQPVWENKRKANKNKGKNCLTLQKLKGLRPKKLLFFFISELFYNFTATGTCKKNQCA
jgi:hypothetical protein